jgi:hypothetical protein
LTLAAVFGRVIYLIWAFDFRTSMIWYVKLITDPITDIAAYYDSVDKIFACRRPVKAQPLRSLQDSYPASRQSRIEVRPPCGFPYPAGLHFADCNRRSRYGINIA